MNNMKLLSKIPLFSLMKNRDLRRITKLSHNHSFKSGELIIREGEIDSRLFVIVSGEVEIIKGLGDQNEELLSVLRSYNYFGEMALLDDFVRTASVVAKGHTEVISLDQWNIREEIIKNPLIAIELLQNLSRRIRAAEGHLSRTEG
jgi:CRP-like cAMP-binding protein